MKKIIIARSILQNLEGSNTIFKRSNITFYPASSSEEIFNLHGVNRVDLIITDSALPLMGGARLCSKIREDVDLKYVSIIVVCDETAASRDQCLNAGANAVIQKPVDYGELLWKVSQFLAVPQRKDMRVLLRVTIAGREGDAPFFAQSRDISISGMQLETDRVLTPGDQLTCSVTITHTEITLTCRVERVGETVSGRHRYGVRFINCDTKTLVVIEHFVKAQPQH
jgi:DNA-binding response OmpR family regulator